MYSAKQDQRFVKKMCCRTPIWNTGRRIELLDVDCPTPTSFGSTLTPFLCGHRNAEPGANPVSESWYMYM